MPSTETLQAARLQHMRRLALLLLLAMAALFVLARTLSARHPAFAYVAAFAEAAMVGGLADWFAVSALFRHPFGLKIPHTAIIPRNKDRIGESIGNFLQYNFMTREVVREELAHVDFAAALANWLADPQRCRAAARQAAAALPPLLHMVDDSKARAFLHAALAGTVEGVRLGPVLAKVLDLLVAGRQHHVLLERVLGIVARALEQNRPYIRQKVHENSPRWLPKAIDDKLFERLLEGVQNIIAEIQADDSEWRGRFDLAARELIDKLANAPDYEDKLHAMLSGSVQHPAFRQYIASVWDALRDSLLADAASPDSVIVARLDAMLHGFGTTLQRDAPVQARINDWLRTLVADTIVDRRDVIAAVVWRVIRKWDAHTVARKFELQVGKDLQYIRINGTLVGGAVGLLLHALSGAMPH